MLEIDGLKYVSKPRLPNAKGTSYGGVALIVNPAKFTCKIIDDLPMNPKHEVIWCLVRPKEPSAKFKDIIACSFYSPPIKGKNTQLADDIASTLHVVSCKYPGCAIILGADRNHMDISPILDSGLKLRQMVSNVTRGKNILDIIIMNTGSYHNSAIIAPPINPDNPLKHKPSDHAVPICNSRIDRYRPPIRYYRLINYRPLPQSSINKFGEWITSETWECLNKATNPTDMVTLFDNLLSKKLDEFCRVKTKRIGSQDEPFITSELKLLHRRKNREYCKRGKSAKYFDLKKEFDDLYKREASNYLGKTVTELRNTNLGKMHAILKRLGARPGDSDDNLSFALLDHVRRGLTSEQSAELIAKHFAAISQEFCPLCVTNLPGRVQRKLQLPGTPPTVNEYQTYRQINAERWCPKRFAA